MVLLGSYLAALIGIGISYWMSEVMAHSHSSTSALGVLVIPVLWSFWGGLALVATWLVGVLVGAAKDQPSPRRSTRLVFTTATLALLLAAATYELASFLAR